MAVEWRLKEALKEQGIANASQLETALANRLGIRISRAALDKLMKRQPSSVRMETMQLLCSLLQLPLQAFLTVTPDPVIRHPGGLIQPYGQRVEPVGMEMVDPGQFF